MYNTVKVKPILLAAVILHFSSYALADLHPKSTPVSIKQATIFTNQAQLTAHAACNVEQGTHTLRFSGFGNSILPNTVQVRAKGAFIILSINQDFNFLQKGAKTAIVKQIKDSIAIMERNMRNVLAQVDVCNKEEAFLQANFSIKGQGNLTPLELQKAVDFFNQKFTENSTKILALNQKSDEIKSRIGRLSEQLRLYETGIKQPEPVIEVTVKASQATKAEFELQYMAGNVGWTPVYDLRVSETATQMQLQLKASTYQNTGLDWDMVKLRFSTGNPVYTGQRPSLTTYYLDFLQPVAYQRKAKMAQSAAYMAAGAPPMAKSEQIMEMQDANTIEDFVSNEDRGLETEFVLDLPVTLPSTTNRMELNLKTSELAVFFQHVAVPKLSSQVFFLANTTGWEKEDLMAGKANIYYDGAFVGTTSIYPNQNTDTVQISLGVDNKVSIKRERNLYQEKNLFGNKKTDTYTFTLTVKNNRKTPTHLRIEDQYPVSQNESLKIDVKEIGGARREEAEGKLIWNLNIKPAEQQVRAFKFTVNYPNDRKLVPIY